MKFKKAWYIINYHDISWEESAFLKPYSIVTPPDLFYKHIENISKLGEFVSFQEGYNRSKNNNITHPLFTITFDDGLKGVRKYGMPILNEFNTVGAVSVCSSFFLHQDIFWRGKLGWLHYKDGDRFVRSKLRKFGFKLYEHKIKNFSLDNFNLDFIEELDMLYKKIASPIFQKDAYRLYDDVNGLKQLLEAGWDLLNHSANHFPVSEESALELFKGEFQRCEVEMKKHLNHHSKFLVLPFDRIPKRAKNAFQVFSDSFDESYNLVYVGNQSNSFENVNNRKIYRFASVNMPAPNFVKYLNKITR